MVNILNIKCADEEEENELSIQMGIVADLIATQFKNITIPEIQEALKMYVAKKFEIKVFRLLDCIAIGEILNAYIDYRNEQTKVYLNKRNIILSTPKELTPEEKEQMVIDGVNRAFDEFREIGTVEGITEYIFDFLVEKGKIKTKGSESLVKYYEQKLSEAKEQLKKENEKTEAKTPAEKKSLTIDLERIVSGISGKILIRAKRNILLEYFKKQVELKIYTIF